MVMVLGGALLFFFFVVFGTVPGFGAMWVRFGLDVVLVAYTIKGNGTSSNG